MIRCPVCGADVPRVHGAPSQVCPRCRAEVDTPVGTRAQARRDRRDTAGAAGRAVRMVVAEYPGWLLFLAPFALAGFAIRALELVVVTALGWTGPALPESPVTKALVVAVGLPLEILAWGVGAAAVGAGAAYAAERAAELRAGAPRRTRVLAVLGNVARRFPALLGAGVLYVAVVVAGTILLVVPGVVFLHRYLWTTAFVARGRGVGQAVLASRDLAVAGRTRAYTLLVALVWLAIVVLSYGAAFALRGAVGEGEMAELAVAAAVAFPLSPLVPALVGSLLAEAEPREAPRPPPAAAPQRAVRCPGCGASVPYTPTGEAQRVACPACGRTGTVRG